MASGITAFFLTFLTFFSCAFQFRSMPEDATPEISCSEVSGDESKYCGVTSCVSDCNGLPTLFINGKPFPAAAYMTYLTEYNHYSRFAQADYSLFSLPVLFSGRWISATDGLTPFCKGIFDEKDAPDFSAVDARIGEIIEACPDAYIIPRVNISMPLWWIEENGGCVDSTGKRESLYSEKWRESAADMLREFIDHVIHSDYASHIAGYHLAGGNTEEWFHFDMNAGLAPAAEPEFEKYLNEYYPDIEYRGLPDLSLLEGKGIYHNSEYLARFLEFASFRVADDIAFLANTAKKASGNQVVVGAFYGYSLEVTSPLYGTHALRYLLKCRDIDFISSPNSYLGERDGSADVTEMYPADSVRLHGKLCLQECDIRTHLTRPLSQAAPEYDPDGILAGNIWQGVKDKTTAVENIEKSFCRQLIKGNGFWWFDMWGGWYDDEDIMNDMSRYRSIYSASLERENRDSKAEAAVFVDESSYKFMTSCSLRSAICGLRRELGNMGAPYDIYDLSDFEQVYGRYKAVIFISCANTRSFKNAVSACRKTGLPFISNSRIKESFTAKELRSFLKANGVHIYCETGDLTYIGSNYFAIHASEEGKKTVTFKYEVSVRELPGGEMSRRSDTFTFDMKAGETKLFELT